MIFDPIFSPLFIIIGVVGLTVFFIWMELQKKHRFRILRCLGLVLIMISLSGIMMHPKYRTQRSNAVLLLTRGYSENQVDSIIDRNPSLSLMHLANTIPFRNSMLVTAADLLEKEIRFVTGEGIPLHLLDRMHHTTFTYIPSTIPEGIVELFVPANSHANRKNSVSGIYNNRHGRVSLRLQSPAEMVDSLEIGTIGQSHFRLSFVPKQAGNFTYTLTIKDSTKTIREVVPVNVTEESTLKILFLQSYPTFETQYLKNYLAQKNHSLILRYQLSKNNFRYEFINHETVPISRLTENLLSNVDIVIADGPSLWMLSPAEKGMLERSVRSGLGVLTLSPDDNKGLSTFFPFETSSIRKDTARVKIGSRSFSLPAANVRVNEGARVVPLLGNQTGILNGYTFLGAGKMGFQLLQETYRLRLSGDSIAYAEIWAPLLERVARHKAVKSKIKMVTPLPLYENEPIDVEIITSDENVTITDGKVQIPLLENFNMDNVWHGRTWAGKKGWHALETGDGEVLHYYVHDTLEWNALSAANRIRANSLIENKIVKGKTEATILWKDVPPVFFYVVVILAAGFIWLSPKV